MEKTAVEKTEKKTCSVKDCKRPYRAKGWCNVHFHKWRRGELDVKPRYKICGEENCRKPLFKKGFCEAHYSAWSASKKGTGQPAAVPVAPAVAKAPAPEAEAKPAN